MKNIKNLGEILVLGMGMTAGASDLVVEPSVRFSFRVLDKEGNEVRHIVPGVDKSAYVLEGYAENLGVMKKPVVALSWTSSLPEQFYVTENVQPKSHYGIEDYFYPNEMDARSNKVKNPDDSNVRRTTIFNSDGTIKNEQEGRTTGGGVFARHTFYVPSVITNFFTGEISEQTNLVVRTISYTKANALESGDIKKSTRTRSLPIAIMPENYAGAVLYSDVNDGQTLANDLTKDSNGNLIVNGRTIGYEPFYAVGPAAYGSYMLQRSTNDASGPYTTVKTISPGSAGSFNDREALTNGWKSVFYRLVHGSESGIEPAAAIKKAGQ